MLYAAKRALVTIALIMASASFAEVGATTDEGCYTDWSDAAPIVVRERLMPASDVHAMTRRVLSGDVVRLTLCRSGSAFIYRIVLRDYSGRLSNRVIDARGP